MEDIWDIKKLVEIHGNTHNKVEVQANSDFRSLTLSPIALRAAIFIFQWFC
jgi:hypothetical protein